MLTRPTTLGGVLHHRWSNPVWLWRMLQLAGILLFVFIGLFWAGLSRADDSPGAELAKLGSSSLLSWSELQTMHLAGVQAYSRAFTSQASLSDAAQTLGVQDDLFQRAIAQKDGMLLSGLKRGWHWVAEINSTAYGVQGLVSALPVASTQPNPGSSVRLPRRFAWLPSPARLHFSQRVDNKAGRVLQQIYSLPLASSALQAHLHKNLELDGWARESGSAWGADSNVWSREASILTLLVQADFPGSLLFVHFFE